MYYFINTPVKILHGAVIFLHYIYKIIHLFVNLSRVSMLFLIFIGQIPRVGDKANTPDESKGQTPPPTASSVKESPRGSPPPPQKPVAKPKSTKDEATMPDDEAKAMKRKGNRRG